MCLQALPVSAAEKISRLVVNTENGSSRQKTEDHCRMISVPFRGRQGVQAYSHGYYNKLCLSQRRKISLLEYHLKNNGMKIPSIM